MLKKIIKKYSTLKFRISPLLILYMLVFTIFRKTYEGFSYIVALTIHEFAHAEEARKRGYVLNSMHFTVFGASLNMQMQAMKSKDERAIATAGPAVNFCLAVFCTALWWTFPSTYFFTLDFVWANVSLLLFNLLPVYPLDGGRVLLSALSEKMPPVKARKILKITGYAISITLFLSFIICIFAKIFNPSFLIVGVFTTLSTFFPDHNSSYERLYRIGYRLEKIQRGLEIKEIAVPPSMSVKNAYKLLNNDKFTCFVLVDKNLVLSEIIPETLVEKYYDENLLLCDLVSKK